MNAATQAVLLAGPAGHIDVARDRPTTGVLGAAVIAHPHPLFGGTRDNKVVQTLARALLGLGLECWRPNFRGVGASDGGHDNGDGETEDLLAVVEHARREAGDAAPVVLAGFSFGAFVQTRVARRLAEAGRPALRLLLVGVATSRFPVEPVAPDTLVVHGELDDTVPLASVFDWARPQDLPILVIPGADHFFHRRLPLLRSIVVSAMASTPLRVAHGA